tara:strand:- start:671 stop:949 length:279 start_codon:yes stop_codon:yes gene_type:complete
MGIIEEYIPPGLRAYQIEEGRVDLTDYLNELQNQIAEEAEEAEEIGIQKNDVIEAIKEQLNIRIKEETPNLEYLTTLSGIVELVIDRVEQQF